MQFKTTNIRDVYVVDLDKHNDERGYFARAWCKNEFDKMGLKSTIVQCNLSFNHKKGTLRGMHYQIHPFEEVKMVRCIQGKIFDVVIDLRKDSDTYKQWIGIELSDENHRMLYVPEGFAHGYQTLEDNSIVYYQVTEFYQPGSETGTRWDDPAFKIEWPHKITSISDKDRNHPDYTE